MKVILVDDELPLIHELTRQLSMNGNVEIIGAFVNPEDAIAFSQNNTVDAAFLDIEMQGMSGISLAEKLMTLHENINVVFITAYNNYASEAFEQNAVDYILKPVRQDRLDKAVAKILSKVKIVNAKRERITEIFCFGRFEVMIDGTSIKWARTKQRELFAYLLQYSGQWIGKFRICDDLWRECGPEQALANLQTAIWSIRKSLREAGCTGIKIEFAHDSYMMSVDNVKWDIHIFENCCKKMAENFTDEHFQLTKSIYKNGYLYGDDWIWSELERNRYMRVFNELKKSLQKYRQS